MGQFISSNRNDKSNDELINTLIKREYIHTINVEKAFRSVDRGLYYTSDNKQNAYRDTAWQYDKIHLSAPSVYATVLECLDLHKGHKFLNIGSGVGYFSTLAGLLLGKFYDNIYLLYYLSIYTFNTSQNGLSKLSLIFYRC